MHKNIFYNSYDHAGRNHKKIKKLYYVEYKEYLFLEAKQKLQINVFIPIILNNLNVITYKVKMRLKKKFKKNLN